MTSIQIELPDMTAHAARDAGLLWHGAAHALIEHVRTGTLAIVSSPALLAELDHGVSGVEVSFLKLPKKYVDPECLLHNTGKYRITV